MLTFLVDGIFLPCMLEGNFRCWHFYWRNYIPM